MIFDVQDCDFKGIVMSCSIQFTPSQIYDVYTNRFWDFFVLNYNHRCKSMYWNDLENIQNEIDMNAIQRILWKLECYCIQQKITLFPEISAYYLDLIYSNFVLWMILFFPTFSGYECYFSDIKTTISTESSYLRDEEYNDSN